MKLVMTLLVRDEEDILDAQLAYHLAAGVDYVVATDHGSRDATPEILERYVRQGVLQVIRESDGLLRQSTWVTRMARMAATDLAADWVINSDADEFWWPSGGDLKAVLSSVPRRYGVVGTFVRAFLPRDGDGSFSERMVVRYTPAAGVNNPAGPFRANARLVHRAVPDVVVGTGNTRVDGSGLVMLDGWSPLEVFHFPIRSFGHFEQKFLAHHDTVRERRRGDHIRAHAAAVEGRLDELYESFRVDDERLRRGLADGSLTLDTRLRDALRHLAAAPAAALRFPTRQTSDELGYAVERAVLESGELVRLHRRADVADRRLRGLERRARARPRKRRTRMPRPGARAPSPVRSSPRIVMTLLVRDEADVVDAHLRFHLDAGVDLVVATDHRSADGTTEILESYAREGYVRMFAERGERIHQQEWVTRMARLAASEYRADWVINSDADEFWWPWCGSLKDVLAAVPADVGVLRPVQRPFVPRPDDERPFEERMTVRLAVEAPINDPSTPYRPVVKVVHRAHSRVVVGRGNHAVAGVPGKRLDWWPAIELFHLPLRSRAQVARKHENTLMAWRANLRGDLARARLASEEGRPWAFYDRVAVDDAAVRRGLADGTLVEDLRLRDAIRSARSADRLTSSRLDGDGSTGLAVNGVDRLAHAVEASCFVEAEVVRLQRWADDLAQRVLAHERGRTVGSSAGR
jgi:hypothetical protein